MGAYLGIHEKTFIGSTTELATGVASGRTELMVNPSKTGAARYLLTCDQDVYLRQGGSSVAATTGDFKLPAGASFVILVTKGTNNNIAALRVSADGTLKCTLLSDEDCG